MGYSRASVSTLLVWDDFEYFGMDAYLKYRVWWICQIIEQIFDAFGLQIRGICLSIFPHYAVIQTRRKMGSNQSGNECDRTSLKHTMTLGRISISFSVKLKFSLIRNTWEVCGLSEQFQFYRYHSEQEYERHSRIHESYEHYRYHSEQEYERHSRIHESYEHCEDISDSI